MFVQSILQKQKTSRAKKYSSTRKRSQEGSLQSLVNVDLKLQNLMSKQKVNPFTEEADRKFLDDLGMMEEKILFGSIYSKEQKIEETFVEQIKPQNKQFTKKTYSKLQQSTMPSSSRIQPQEKILNPSL